MGRPKKDQVKQSVGINRRHYDWITEYAEENGIEFSAAVNVILRKGIKLVEAEERAGEEHPPHDQNDDEQVDSGKRSNAAGVK